MSIFEEILPQGLLNRNELIRLDTILDMIVELCRQHHNPTILDLGCGDGRMTIALSKMGYNVIGIDSSEEALERAWDLIDRNNPDYDIFIITQDARKLEFSDSVFDIVICSEVLEHIERDDDFDKVIGEMKRVCKDSGHILITVPYKDAVKGSKKYPHYREFTYYDFFDYFSYFEYFDIPVDSKWKKKWIAFITVNGEVME